MNETGQSLLYILEVFRVKLGRSRYWGEGRNFRDRLVTLTLLVCETSIVSSGNLHHLSERPVSFG
jgi:hypothetical protein